MKEERKKINFKEFQFLMVSFFVITTFYFFPSGVTLIILEFLFKRHTQVLLMRTEYDIPNTKLLLFFFKQTCGAWG